MAMIVNLPGIDLPCLVTDERVSKYNATFKPGESFWMTTRMYDEVLAHNCPAFALLNSANKRLRMRGQCLDVRWFGLQVPDIITFGSITARRYQVSQMTTSDSILAGGFLLGFDDMADAVMFRLTYSEL